MRRCGSVLLVSLITACCGAALTGCGPSLSNEFELLQAQQKAGSDVAEQKSGSGVMLASASGADPLRMPASAAALSSVGTPGSTGYKIGPADVLDISVFKVPELARTVMVDDTGTISLPLLGEVRAAFIFSDTATNEIYTRSLHNALRPRAR